ncbi:MAG TPA: hypothetical protein VGA15_17415 [Bradyrhizobium sp.]
MAQDSDHLAGFDTENTGGFLSGLLAEEDHIDRRALWRLGSWGVATIGAIIVAVLASQSSIGLRREQMTSADLALQSQQIQSVAKESQSEARRLASAIETLNSDRDRLYARVTVLEQGLDTVTGAIARQNSAPARPQAATTAPATPEPPQPASQNPAPAPVVSPVAAAPAKPAEKPPADTAPAKDSSPAAVSPVAQAPQAQAPQNSPKNSPAVTPATPLMASKSMLAPPDAPAGKLIPSETPMSAITASPMPEVVASAQAGDVAERDPPKVAVQRTEFGVDVGSANSLGGLRALWRGLLRSKSNAPLAALRPIIVVKESNSGLGMQLRLVAGPLADAAAAAKICAVLLESERTCETTVFDGQRLSMKAEEVPASVVKPSASRRRGSGKRAVQEEPPKKPETSTTSTLSSMFSRVTRAQ